MKPMELKNHKRIWQKLMIAALACLFIATMVPSAFATKFPHRQDYPSVATIGSENLIKDYEAGAAIIVDVRSKIEFQVIHPKKPWRLGWKIAMPMMPEFRNGQRFFPKAHFYWEKKSSTLKSN